MHPSERNGHASELYGGNIIAIDIPAEHHPMLMYGGRWVQGDNDGWHVRCIYSQPFVRACIGKNLHWWGDKTADRFSQPVSLAAVQTAIYAMADKMRLAESATERRPMNMRVHDSREEARAEFGKLVPNPQMETVEEWVERNGGPSVVKVPSRMVTRQEIEDDMDHKR